MSIEAKNKDGERIRYAKRQLTNKANRVQCDSRDGKLSIFDDRRMRLVEFVLQFTPRQIDKREEFGVQDTRNKHT